MNKAELVEWLVGRSWAGVHEGLEQAQKQARRLFVDGEDDTVVAWDLLGGLGEVHTEAFEYLQVLMDAVDSVLLKVMAAERSNTAGALKLLGLQLTIKRVSKYSAAART